MGGCASHARAAATPHLIAVGGDGGLSLVISSIVHRKSEGQRRLTCGQAIRSMDYKIYQTGAGEGDVRLATKWSYLGVGL